MRSVVYIVMLAFCLNAWESSGNENGSPIEERGLNGQSGDILTTKTTTAVQVISQPEPQANGEKTEPQHVDPAPIEPAPAVIVKDVSEPGVDKTDEEGEQEAAAEEEEKEEEEEDKAAHPHNKGKTPSVPSPQPPTSPLITQPGQPSAEKQQKQQQQQQQQQQSQPPQQISRQVSVPTDNGTSGTSHNQNHAAPTRTSGEELHTSQVVPQARIADARTGQLEHQAPEPRPEEQHSPSSHSTGEVEKKTEATQPKTAKQTDNAQSGRSPPQAPPPTQPIIKSKTTVNDTTTSGTGAAPAEKKNVPPKKTTPTSTPAADNAVRQTDTTTGDKETHTEQTSVSSTSEPVEGKSIPVANLSANLTKGLPSLDKKDSSVDSSLLFALTTLVTLVVMAISSAC